MRTTLYWGVFSKRVLIAAAVALLAEPVAHPSRSQDTDSRFEGMVLVPAGEFRMGSQEDEHFAAADEKPQRILFLPGFYIDQFEVANIEYKRFIDATGYPPPSGWRDGQYPEDADFHPVIEVSWWEATAYARWAGKRLPLEEEWEKAARGTDARRFPWGNKQDPALANTGDGYAPVNSFFEGASPFGVIQMAGNVAEWTASVYAPYPELDLALPDAFGGDTRPPPVRHRQLGEDEVPELAGRQPYDDDPLLQFFTAAELRDDRDRVYRGGSINNFSEFLRCANREKANPRSRWYNIGFRCVMDPPADTD